jgi:hypothetical protein
MTPIQAHTVMTETYPNESAWDVNTLNVSVIERFKRRNHIISQVVAVAFTVAALALFIFAIVHFLIIPGCKLVPAGNHQGPQWHNHVEPPKITYKDPGKLPINFFTPPKMVNEDPGKLPMGCVLLPFGIFGIPLLGLGVFEAMHAALERNTIKPLRELKAQMVGPNLDNEHLRTLIKRCDTTARKALIPLMNFDQLKEVRPVLGDRVFMNLIRDVPHEAHQKWKTLIELERESGSGFTLHIFA